MGSSNDLPNPPTSNQMMSDQLLSEIKQNLKTFQQDLVGQLTADVGRLQAEKVELLTAINELKREQKALQTQQQSAISQQQVAQQKIWAKQLAEALATRLYVLLAQKIDQAGVQNTGFYGAPSSTGQQPPMGQIPMGQPSLALGTPSAFQTALPAQASPANQQALSVLNTKLNAALGSLQYDLGQTNSPLIHQINQAGNAASQGEVLLDQLVTRLRTQFQSSGSIPVETPYQPPTQAQPPEINSQALEQDTVSPPSSPSSSAPAPKSPTPFVQRWADQLNLSHFQLGLILVLFSTLSLSLHNVAVGVIGAKSSLFGVLPEIGGVINLMSLDSSLVLLWLRMLIVVPLMASIASFLYPPAWSKIKAFFQARDPKMLGTVIGSGGFLFLSQILIYIAIGNVGPGVAVTLLFMYPIVTVPLAWIFFNDRPTILRWFVLTGVFFGIVLAADLDLATLQTTGNANLFGIGVALLSGLFFAFYLISMQLSFQRLHPVPVSVIQFFTIFVLTSLSLIAHPADPDKTVITSTGGLFIGALILGALTLLGYLVNNFGIRYMGAARASIIASSGPALTAFLGWIMMPDTPRFHLEPIQWLGIILVTVCVASLSLERLFMQQPKTTPASD